MVPRAMLTLQRWHHAFPKRSPVHNKVFMRSGVAKKASGEVVIPYLWGGKKVAEKVLGFPLSEIPTFFLSTPTGKGVAKKGREKT